MERLDRNVRPANGAFQQCPEIFDAIGMHVAFYVILSMTHEIMNEITVLCERRISAVLVGVNRRTFLNHVYNFVLHRTSVKLSDNLSPYFRAASVPLQ